MTLASVADSERVSWIERAVDSASAASCLACSGFTAASALALLASALDRELASWIERVDSAPAASCLACSGSARAAASATVASASDREGVRNRASSDLGMTQITSRRRLGDLYERDRPLESVRYRASNDLRTVRVNGSHGSGGAA